MTHTHINLILNLIQVEQENHKMIISKQNNAKKRRKQERIVRNVGSISHSKPLKTAPDVVSSVSAGEECVSTVLLSFSSVGSEEL